MLALQKAHLDLPFFLKADRFVGIVLSLSVFTEELGPPCLLPGLRTLAGLSSGIEELLVKQMKGGNPLAAVPSGRSPHSLPPKTEKSM